MAAEAAPGRSRGGLSRREAILIAAADLFSTRGYPSTGIDEIGEAVGITGPGVYRHFENKGEVLAEVIRRAIESLIERVADIVGSGASPDETLKMLVDNLVDTVLADPAPFAVMAREQLHLDSETRQTVTRAHRLHVEEWVYALTQMQPSLTDTEARTIVHGVFAITLSAANRHPGVDDTDALAKILRTMSMQVLLEVPSSFRA